MTVRTLVRIPILLLAASLTAFGLQGNPNLGGLVDTASVRAATLLTAGLVFVAAVSRRTMVTYRQVTAVLVATYSLARVAITLESGAAVGVGFIWLMIAFAGPILIAAAGD